MTGSGASACWGWAIIVWLPFPYYGWLEQPFQKYVGGDRIAFCADAGEDIRRLIVFPSHMVKFEPLEPS